MRISAGEESCSFIDLKLLPRTARKVKSLIGSDNEQSGDCSLVHFRVIWLVTQPLLCDTETLCRQ